ncbi:MAG TPA: hypothetical protein VFU14_03990 [Acidimicrobiales bacterium]|nr:hypothetical protein [Acidimicrobiales bacterium]
MPGTTEPKGRPTPGRRDRSVVQHRQASRRRVIRYAWAVLAVVVLLALLVLGTGSGGDGATTTVGGLITPLAR